MTVTRVVGVHGAGQFRADLDPRAAEEHLRTTWLAALHRRRTDTSVGLRIAYYAHHLHGEPRQTAATGLNLPAAAAGDVRAWARELGAVEVPLGPATVPVRHVVDWVARRFGLNQALVHQLVGTFFAEVDTYLRVPGSPARERARAAVGRVISEHRPSVIIAHSLGSIVTYEALHQHPEVSVDLLVTLGSPLGMPHVVYERLVPSPAESRRPPNVRRWVNVSDVGDIVAVPPRLKEFFDVDVDLDDEIGLFAFHSAEKYLASRTFAGIAAAAL